MNEITWNDFEKVELRIGTVVEVESFPEARNPAYKIKIDFGEIIGIKWSSAQITETYSMGELIGVQVVAVINFPKKQIANFMSECLVLGAVKNKEVILLKPERKVANGLRIL